MRRANPRRRRSSLTGSPSRTHTHTRAHAHASRWLSLLVEPLETRTLLASITADSLQFEADAWSQNGSTFSATGTIQIGYQPTGGESFNPLLQVVGSMALTVGAGDSSFNATGDLDAIAVPGQTLPLWKGTATFQVSELAGSGAPLTDAEAVPVVGTSFISSNVRLNNPGGGSTSDAQVLLQGGFHFTDLVGATVGVTGSNAIQLDGGGITINAVDSTVSTEFKLFGLSVSPSSLSVAYLPSDQAFTFYGAADAATAFGEVTNMAVTLGTQSMPGMTVQHDTVASIQFGLPNGMVVWGLPIASGDLAFTYDSADQQYEIYGSTTATISGAELTVGMGDEQQPGMIIDDTGKITQMTQSVNGSFNIFGIALAPVNEGLTLSYNGNPADPEHIISGTAGLIAVFGATVTLGTATQPGIVVKQGEFEVENFQIDVGRIPLGAFNIGGLMLEWTTDDQGNRLAGGSLSLSFPAGWAIGGSLVFRDGKLDDISLQYAFTGTITPTNQPIYLGDTGLFITKVAASVQNIDQPSNLIVSGTFAVGFGDQIAWQGQVYTPFIASGQVTVDRNELILEADAYFLAVDIEGSITALGGSAQAKLDLDWGQGQYSLSGKLTQYDDTFEVDFAVSFDSSGDFTIVADAEVKVPSFVPFIGGKELAGLDFVFEYRKHTDPPTSFAAAWLELDIFHKFDIGVKFDILTGHGSVIGTSAVDAIKQGESNPTPSTYNYYSSFTVPAGATAGTFSIGWPQAGGTQTVSIVPPGQMQPIKQADFSSGNGLSLVPSLSSSTTTAVHVVGDASDPDKDLPAGEYQVILTSSQKFALTSVQFTGSFFYPKPTIAVGSLPPNPDHTNMLQVPLAGTVDDAFASAAKVAVYVDTDDSGYDGVKIADAIQFDPQGMAVDWDLTGLLPAPNQYYLYAIIDDGFNAPVKSGYSSPVSPVPPLSGQVMNAMTNVGLAGWTVFLDSNGNGEFDPPVCNDDGFCTLGDPSTTTGPTGFYDFFGIPTNEQITVGIIVPKGFVIASNSSVLQHVTYDGTDPLNVIFGVDQLNSISGVVYRDATLDGTFDPNTDTPLPGWTVLLDTNGNGLPDDGELTTQSNASGHYEFLALTAGESYTVKILLQPDHFQTGPTPVPPGTYAVAFAASDQFKLVENQDFGVAPLPTISGSITGHAFRDGHLDPLAEFLEGWTVHLMQGETVVATTTTDAGGSYSFTNVAPGAYTIRQVVQSGWREVSPFKSQPGFEKHVITSPGSAPRAVATGDFDGDGHADYAIANNGSNIVSVFYGAGDGTFGHTVASAASLTTPLRLVSLDFNGDGKLDLAVLSTSGEVDVLTNAGGRVPFTLIANAFAWPSGLTPLDMAAGDFNGDKHDDLAVSYTGGAQGAGFAILVASTRQVLRNDVLAAGGGVAVGDFNGDNKLDLVLNGGQEHLFSYLERQAANVAYGDGTGHFPQLVEVQVGHSNGGGAAVGDFNGDGLLDYAVGSDMPSYLDVSIGTGFQVAGGTFDPTAGIELLDTSLVAQRLIVQDFDGDLRPDIAWLSTDSPRLRIAINSGPPRFFYILQPNLFQVLSPAGNTPLDMAAADFNGDGLIDLVVVDPGQSGASVLLNTAAITADIPVTARADSSGNDFVNAQLAQIAGAVFLDANGSGTREAADEGKPGVRVYLDLNRDGRLDDNEPSTSTVGGGAYAFAGLADGEYLVRIVRPEGHLLTAPEPMAHLVVVQGEDPAEQFHDFAVTVNAAPVITSLRGPRLAMQGRRFEISGAFTDERFGGAHRVVVDWGDGTTSDAVVQSSGAGGTFTAAHTYRAGGFYAVTVAVMDGADDTVRGAATITVPVTGARVHGNVLEIVGTETDDRIIITPHGRDQVRIKADFLPGKSALFSRSQIQRIEASLFDGDDHVTMAASLRMDLLLK